jgi:hypothetical protein
VYHGGYYAALFRYFMDEDGHKMGKDVKEEEQEDDLVDLPGRRFVPYLFGQSSIEEPLAT